MGGVRDRSDSLEGRYANYFVVGHTADEFIIDFGQAYEGAESAMTHTRIIATAPYIKELVDALTTAMRDYERLSER
jgi:hypothetical protein